MLPLGINTHLGFLREHLPIILYLMGIVLLIVTVFSKRREYGLYILVFIIPMVSIRNKINLFPSGSNLVDFLMLALLISWVLKGRTPNDNLGLKRPENKFIIIYFLLTYAYLWWGSIIHGIDLPIALDNIRFMEWKNHALLIVLYFVTLGHVKNRRQIIILVSIMLVTILFADRTFSATAHTEGHFDWRRRGEGIFSTLGPNEMGAFFADYIFLALGILFYQKKRIYRYLLLVLIIYTVYCILFTYSRGAYTGFSIGILYIVFLRKKIFLIPIVIILIYWQTMMPAPVVERLSMTKTEEGIFEESTAGRITLWKQGLSLFASKPMGHGFETTYLLGLKTTEGGKSRFDVHNKYVEFLIEMGVVGVAIFICLLFVSFKAGWRLYKAADDPFFKGLGLGFTACVISVAVTNFFGDRWTYMELGAYFWVSWALVGKAIQIVESKKESLKVAKVDTNI